MTGRPPWQKNALCVQAEDRDLMFPPVTDAVRVRTAKEWCVRCPVMGACAEWALENRVEHGVWGGMDERERRRILKARAAARDAA